MATTSPTPMANGLVRRTSQRQAMRRPPSRSGLSRSDSHLALSTHTASRTQSKQYNDDSSEDEIPVPMKLSALTKALLNDGEPEPAVQSVRRPPSPPLTRRRSALNASVSSVAERGRFSRSGSEQPSDGQSTPPRDRGASPVRKRVVRLSGASQSVSQLQSSKRRSTSGTRQRPTQQTRPESRDKSASEERFEAPTDFKTPAPGTRVVRISTSFSGSREQLGSSGPSSGRSFDRSAGDRSALEADYDQSEVPETVARNPPPIGLGSVSRYTSTRNRQEEANLQSSMRIKRVGKIPGSFLSGPARRGRRRQSEEDGELNGEGDHFNSNQDYENRQSDDAADPYYADGIRDYSSGSPVSGSSAARAIHRRQVSNLDLRGGSGRPSPRGIELELEQEPQQGHQQEKQGKREEEEEEEEIPYRNSVRKSDMPSRRDQENDVLSSYRRYKPSVEDLKEKAAPRPLSTDLAQARNVSPERKPLASIANNTPHRAAPPPPPKMSVLEAAISNTGAAATTQTKQKRNVLRVNGKSYTRLECLGRGGSAKVYRVTAENGQMFALKRVALENADEATIRGYKGEIDLLGKLTNVDRVINLHAYELNSEKQVLSLVMEMGERDLNNVLASRQNSDTARFDPVFVRFYWKEMLECLQSVHQYDIVHSDLKPANFVLVKGQLKLIDFGIANAIQTDETVNVHRETQIGTPNYMSPESLIDSNNPRGGRLPGRPKLMKLGKPSDVWSLGCILYQMVYGIPPFGHIPNQMARCQAIINWDHDVEFPSRGMGGAPVPPSLIRTMKRCLNRDLHMRPTCEELLHDTDPFLYPAEISDKALPIEEEFLGRIIQNVVQRCRDRMPTEAELLSTWPQAYWSHVKKQAANRM
ncbi:Serine/threonine-protein kinase MPS1 [Cladobotryum mycophilum]|uniref:Serine/threonine-protein kinase MPS1 n=1 Tax=Cladobotryum mycophilum TaxID=491253 RepID=A0ABR0S5F7_9HYPO